MKSIILFRHGRPNNGGFTPDHDRPLASDGISDAKKMGLYLAGENQIPDLVISSTAFRAKTTAEVAMAEGKWPCTLELNAGIYGGNPLFLLRLSNFQDNSLSSICFVGHEPTFSTFIALLTDNYHQRFSKGSMAMIDFNVKSWKEIKMASGCLIWQVDPDEV